MAGDVEVHGRSGAARLGEVLGFVQTSLPGKSCQARSICLFICLQNQDLQGALAL